MSNSGAGSRFSSVAFGDRMGASQDNWGERLGRKLCLEGEGFGNRRPCSANSFVIAIPMSAVR